ncbi:MAG: phenylacetate--CoA ligase family protein [Candidatus Scalinduaceae bacterium]
MLDQVLKSNVFYRQKLKSVGVRHPLDVQTFEDYRQLPFTTKDELSSDQKVYPPYGSNLTFQRETYTRIHQTSGTKGEPLRWLDTEESWKWWARCWATVYKAIGVNSTDRIFFAFSFGPFIGFWSAYEGARLIGALSIPGGGMSSLQRLNAILAHDVTVLVCTPTYALHLAEVAGQEDIDITKSKVRLTIHAGEPGASLPSTKFRIETVWGSLCYDHAGATEVGAWGFECQPQYGVCLNEGEFIFEVIDPATDQSVEEGELVITNLGRVGMPLVRYRTGDKVRLRNIPCECGRNYSHLEGGVIGRIDDALVIRGVNVFPSAIENIVRRFSQIGEFAVDVYRRHELDEMEIRLEVNGATPDTIANAVAKEIRNGLGLRVNVKTVPYGTLPCFDLKARRITDHRLVNGVLT